MRIFILILSFLLAYNISFSQLYSENVIGLIGSKINIPIYLDSNFESGSDIITIQGVLTLEKPEVFIPEKFKSSNYDLEYNFVRINNSTYNFNLIIRNITKPYKNPVIYLNGEALASSDTICYLLFDGIYINNQQYNEFSSNVILSNYDIPMPYIRLAVLEQNYPNPVNSGNQTTWVYKIDKNSKVIFKMYNLLMKEVFAEDLGDINKGVNEYIFKYSSEFSAGCYWMSLNADSEVVYKKFLIIK